MSALCFMLIKDEPVYELELAPRRDEASARAAHLVLHGALDLVDRAIAPAAGAGSGAGSGASAPAAASACFLKVVDRHAELLVSAYVTAGGARLMLLHDGRGEDGVRAFFQETHELYVKVLMDPFYTPGSRIVGRDFDERVRALARRYLGVR